MFKGGYKQKIKTLSENNKSLVEALENYRYQCSEKDKLLVQVSTTALQNSIVAKAKLNKLAKDLKETLLSVEDIISFINMYTSSFPSIFVPNQSKLKKAQNCLSKLNESISEATQSNWDNISTSKPHSSQGEIGSFMENESTNSTSTKTKYKNSKQKITSSHQNQNKEKVLGSALQSKTPDFSTDLQKPLPSNKRRRNSKKVQLQQEVSNQIRKRKRKSNPLYTYEITTEMNELLSVSLLSEPSGDETLYEPTIYEMNTNHPQNVANKGVFQITNISVDQHPEDFALQENTVMSEKSKVTSIPKVCKTNRQTMKNSNKKLNNCGKSRYHKKTKTFANMNLPVNQAGNKPKVLTNLNINTTRLADECSEKDCVYENLNHKERVPKKTKENIAHLSNGQILSSDENMLSDEAIKITVTADVHEPPSDVLAEKKTCSLKLMQPCVVLTDIYKTDMMIEKDARECSKETTLKVKKKPYGTRQLRSKQVSETNENTSLCKSLRIIRNRTVKNYKEKSLNVKLRRE